MDITATLSTLLYEQYHISPASVEQIKGGWSALAYLVRDRENKKYLLKAYEKSRASTSRLASRIEDYMPVVNWLNENTSLKGRIISPLGTARGKYSAEDTGHIYLLLKYIDGNALTDEDFRGEDVVRLADIVAELHQYGENIPLPVHNLREDFDVSFCDLLLTEIRNEAMLRSDLKELITPYINRINKNTGTLREMSARLKTRGLKHVICHTDIHGGNIIRGNNGIVLIDWEGLKFAPPEADLFGLTERSWFGLFYEIYRIKHPCYQINETALGFYRLRRTLEDIWEFVEQLQFDPVDPDGRAEALFYLHKEFEKLMPG